MKRRARTVVSFEELGRLLGLPRGVEILKARELGDFSIDCVELILGGCLPDRFRTAERQTPLNVAIDELGEEPGEPDDDACGKPCPEHVNLSPDKQRCVLPRGHSGCCVPIGARPSRRCRRVVGGPGAGPLTRCALKIAHVGPCHFPPSSEDWCNARLGDDACELPEGHRGAHAGALGSWEGESR